MSDYGVTREFGVVFFDDINEPKDGFACVAKGQAFRVSGINELSTDVIWWTNITYEAFYKRTEAWRSPWLRHDKYLVVSPKDVLLEWAVDPKTVAGDYAAQLVSNAFSRIMNLSFNLIRDVHPRSKMEEVFTGKFLREDMRCILPELEYPKGEAANIIKSGSAWQEFTRTTIPSIKGGRWLMLRKPRLAYAHEMLQIPVPKGPFEFYGRADMRSVARDKLKWVINNDNPCIAEISINKLDGDIAPVYGFGNATEKDHRISRSWVSHPELVVMSKFSEIEVKSLYMGYEYDLIGPQLPEAVKDFLTDRYSETSWSVGVVAETIWRALALGEDKAKVIPGEERAHTSWQGAWIKGADKSLMFLSAMQLTEKGYSVVSYGLGWLRIAVAEDNVPDLIKDALTVGLIPHINDVVQKDSGMDPLFNNQEPIPWGGDKASHAFAQMLCVGKRDLLWMLDDTPLLPPKKRKPYVMQVMNVMKKKGI